MGGQIGEALGLTEASARLNFATAAQTTAMAKTSTTYLTQQHELSDAIWGEFILAGQPQIDPANTSSVNRLPLPSQLGSKTSNLEGEEMQVVALMMR